MAKKPFDGSWFCLVIDSLPIVGDVLWLSKHGLFYSFYLSNNIIVVYFLLLLLLVVVIVVIIYLFYF